MTNPVPHQVPHQSHDLRELQRDLGRTLEAGLKVDAAPRVAPKPGAGGPMWGPSTPRVTSPLETLLEVVDQTYRLQQQVEMLVVAVTGEPTTPVRARNISARPCGLLPNVAQLSGEIAGIHDAIERRVAAALRAIS